MGGNHSRTKGFSFEREIANKFKEFYPEARRHLEYHSSDANGVDLINTGDWQCQLKRYKQYAPISKIEEIQVEGNHLLITKADRKPAILCMYLDCFFDMLRKIFKLEKEVVRLQYQLDALAITLKNYQSDQYDEDKIVQ